MDRTITLPAGATFQYPIFDMLFRRNEYELKIPGKFILALAFLGGAIVLRKIASLGQSLVRGIVSRERVALTRNDGHENFEDRYAIITGADGLMGRAYAKELAARSFNLIIIGHDAEKLEDLTRDIMTHIGVNVKPVVTDIKDTTDMDVFRTKLETYCEFINV
jgi:short-subunit dehydrogenase